MTVQNIVVPHPTTSIATSSDVSAADEDFKVGGAGSADAASHSSSSVSGSDFGALVCRKRKSPIVPVGGPDKPSESGAQHTQGVGGGGGGEDGRSDEALLKRARASLDSPSIDSSALQSDATAVKQHTDTVHEDTAVKSSRLIPESVDPTNIIIKNDFGSEVLKVSFTDEMWSRLLVPPAVNTSTLSVEGYTDAERASYGVKYNFSLKDKATEAAVDAPEWLVPQVSTPPDPILSYSTLPLPTLSYST